MNEDKFKRYLIDTIRLLKKQAREAKKDTDNPKEGCGDTAEGMLMGYCAIINLLKHQARAFCIDQNEVGLADIEPEVDLLGLHRNPDIDYGENDWVILDITEKTIQGYLSDSITILEEWAKDIKKDEDHSQGATQDYNGGWVMGYRLTFSLLKNQAAIFNIDEEELGLMGM